MVKAVFVLAAMLVAALQPHVAGYYPREIQRPTPKLERPQQSGRQYILGCQLAMLLFAFEEAERQCGQAIEADAHNATAFKWRGYAYLLEHRFEHAAADFKVAISLAPKDAENYAGYGEALAGIGQFESSLSWFSRAIALKPSDARFWNARCWARAGSGRMLALALRDCDRALRLAPDLAAALDSRGLVHLRLGRLADAEADYTDALGKRSWYATAWFGRGLARLRHGKVDAGRQDLAKARSIDPEIDDLFVRLGVLAPGCSSKPPAKAICDEKNFPRAFRPAQPVNPVAAGPQAQIAALLGNGSEPRRTAPVDVCTRRRDAC